MRLGLSIGYWSAGVDLAAQAQVVEAADESGFDSVWTSEAYGSDAVSLAAWFAGRTKNLGIGTAIMQMPARGAAATAMTAATLDTLTGGRFKLGLGPSGPQVSEGWHGVAFDRQLLRTREYIDVVRLALSRQPLIYAGESIDLPLPDGRGKPLKLMISAVADRVPILLAAMGPKAVELAGEVADGWLPLFFSPAHVDGARASLAAGAAKGGRDVSDVEICPAVNLALDEDVDVARDLLRPALALYVGGMGPRDGNFYARLAASYGFEDEVGRVQDLYLGGYKAEAAAALPADLIDAVSLVGPPDRVRDRLALYEEAGVETLIITPVATVPARRAADVRQVARLLGEVGG